MKAIIERMEDKAINKYGFESKATIFIFRVTEAIRNTMNIK